jgi:protein ImuA
MAECLRCRAIRVTIGALNRLTQVQARRLQLAAERGGGVGILLRPYSAASTTYAASTRWLVRPAPGDEDVQRWKIQLIHGQGGLVGRSILLEANREANLVRASEIVADRPAQAKITRATG